MTLKIKGSLRLHATTAVFLETIEVKRQCCLKCGGVNEQLSSMPKL